jgi:hypothetical protein
MRLWLSLLPAFGLGPAPAANPDIIVRYEGVVAGQPDARRADMPILGVAADGAGHARVVIGAGHGGMEMLTRDNVGYVFIVHGSEEIVGRQEDMLALMTIGRQGAENREKIALLAQQRLEIVPGGTERIAGFEGRIYRLNLVEGERRSPPLELVISTDPRLGPVGRELLRFVDSLRAPIVAIAGSEPQPYAAARALFALGTPLRIGDFQMVSVDRRDLPDSAYALPGPVLGREQFTAFMLRGPMAAEMSELRDVPAEGNGNVAADGPGNESDPR